MQAEMLFGDQYIYTTDWDGLRCPALSCYATLPVSKEPMVLETNSFTSEQQI